ncbi:MULTISPECIES: hypothetical protein [unclassified Bacillus (in: firmicutes)]|uniref:hypothetical protein n=1 Tax=unclassified Bacillus (in: firmicutes) TaxID=185979 RepID=UPI00300FCBF9
MKQLKILKVENPIQELCIAYGLLAILRQNDVSCKLSNKKACYLIEIYDEVDYVEFFLDDLPFEKVNNLNSTINKSEIEKLLAKIQEFFECEQNLDNIFKYYETLDESIISSYKRDEGALYVGTCFYSKGLRSYKAPKSERVYPFEKFLSFLGFHYASSYVRLSDEVEISWLLEPKEIEDVLKIELFSYVDKETGEIKSLRKIRDDSKVVTLSRIYLEIIQYLKGEQISNNYDGLWVMQVVPTNNKPLMDKVKVFTILNLNEKSLEELLKKVTYSTVNRDCKYATASYVLNPDEDSLFKMIQQYVKRNETISENTAKELLKLNAFQDIYNAEVITKLGRGLNRLVRDKKGYSLQVSLMSCVHEEDLIEVLQEMSLLYNRNYKTYLLNDENMNELMSLLNDGVKLKTLSNLILLSSNTYKEKVQKNEKISLDNNQAYILTDENGNPEYKNVEENQNLTKNVA